MIRRSKQVKLRSSGTPARFYPRSHPNHIKWKCGVEEPEFSGAYMEIAFANNMLENEAGYRFILQQRKGVNAMKTLLSIFALTLALAFTGSAFKVPTFIGPAFAGDVKDAKTEGDCIMANGTGMIRPKS